MCGVRSALYNRQRDSTTSSQICGCYCQMRFAIIRTRKVTLDFGMPNNGDKPADRAGQCLVLFSACSFASRVCLCRYSPLFLHPTWLQANDSYHVLMYQPAATLCAYRSLALLLSRAKYVHSVLHGCKTLQWCIEPHIYVHSVYSLLFAFFC